MMAVETALACQICVPLPTQTLADQLLDSDAVVLAREDPQRPYHYAAVEVLKGNPGIDSIDLFVNTPTRRQLKANPESAALLVRNPKKVGWRTFGITNDAFNRTVRHILRNKRGLNDARARLSAHWQFRPSRISKRPIRFSHANRSD